MPKDLKTPASPILIEPFPFAPPLSTLADLSSRVKRVTPAPRAGATRELRGSYVGATRELRGSYVGATRELRGSYAGASAYAFNGAPRVKIETMRDRQ